MSSTLKVLTAAALAIWLSSAAHAQYQYPPQPVSPTWEDCTALMREYHAILGDLVARMNNCMRQEPQFGIAVRCDGTVGTVPWLQCQDLARDRCQVEEDTQSAVSQCRFAALANPQSGPLDSMLQFQKAADAASEAYGAYRDVSSLLTNPATFFRNSVQGRIESELREYLYPYGELSKEGEEVYRYLFRTARYGARQTPDPAVGVIQGELLSYLESRLADLLLQLDHVSGEMKRF